MEVTRPAAVDEVAATLRDATAAELALVPRGAGTKRHWGAAPRRCDLEVDLSGLDRIIDHAAGDMVVQVQAGVPLGRLAEALAGPGQQLAIDIPCYDDGTHLAAGTVGGALAVGVGGPRQLRYGLPRDLLLGVTVVRADGAVASSGGRVVKNVAGYDLGKLLCGSYGTLGLIVEATLRLHPLPAATAWMAAVAPDAASAYRCSRAVLDSQLMPSAVEVDQPRPGGPLTVAAMFEGTGDGVAARAAVAAGLAGGEVTDTPPEWFGRWPGGPDDTLVDLTVPPASLAEVLDAVDAAARASGVTASVRGSAGTAALHVALPDEERVADVLAALRAGVAAYSGHAVVRHAPEPVRTSVDVWGPVDPGALALMRRVKDQFDPDHRLCPGCFVGGI